MTVAFATQPAVFMNYFEAL